MSETLEEIVTMIIATDWWSVSSLPSSKEHEEMARETARKIIAKIEQK